MPKGLATADAREIIESIDEAAFRITAGTMRQIKHRLLDMAGPDADGET